MNVVPSDSKVIPTAVSRHPMMIEEPAEFLDEQDVSVTCLCHHVAPRHSLRDLSQSPPLAPLVSCRAELCNRTPVSEGRNLALISG